MEKPVDVLYGESNETYRVMEASIQPDLPPTIASKISTYHVTIQDGTLTFVHKMQVLHHVRYFKLYTYVKQHSSNIQT